MTDVCLKPLGHDGTVIAALGELVASYIHEKGDGSYGCAKCGADMSLPRGSHEADCIVADGEAALVTFPAEPDYVTRLEAALTAIAMESNAWQGDDRFGVYPMNLFRVIATECAKVNGR